MIDIFGYINNWSDKDHKKNFIKHVKKSYILKSLILITLIPYDIIYLIYKVIKRNKKILQI